MSTLPPNSMIRFVRMGETCSQLISPFSSRLCGQFALSSFGLSIQLSRRLHPSHSCSGNQNWDTVESRNSDLSIAFYCSTCFEKISSTSFIAIAFSCFSLTPVRGFSNQIWSIKISTDHILFRQCLNVLWLKNYFWPSSVNSSPKPTAPGHQQTRPETKYLLLGTNLHVAAHEYVPDPNVQESPTATSCRNCLPSSKLTWQWKVVLLKM